jgi:hypothetical protein
MNESMNESMTASNPGLIRTHLGERAIATRGMERVLGIGRHKFECTFDTSTTSDVLCSYVTSCSDAQKGYLVL